MLFFSMELVGGVDFFSSNFIVMHVHTTQFRHFVLCVCFLKAFFGSDHGQSGYRLVLFYPIFVSILCGCCERFKYK